LEKILKGFEKITNDLPQKLPPSFADIYSELESKSRDMIKKSPDKAPRFMLIKKKLKEKEILILIPLRLYRSTRIIFPLVKNIFFK